MSYREYNFLYYLLDGYILRKTQNKTSFIIGNRDTEFLSSLFAYHKDSFLKGSSFKDKDIFSAEALY